VTVGTATDHDLLEPLEPEGFQPAGGRATASGPRRWGPVALALAGVALAVLVVQGPSALRRANGAEGLWQARGHEDKNPR